MQTVRDESGSVYVLLKRSSDTSRVRDPRTGEERYLPTDELELVDGRSPLESVASGVSESVRRVLSATHDDRSLGLLLSIADDGPVSVVWLLEETTLCESDLHGLLAEFRAAGLVTETDVDGRRRYKATATLEEAAELLRHH